VDVKMMGRNESKEEEKKWKRKAGVPSSSCVVMGWRKVRDAREERDQVQGRRSSRGVHAYKMQ